MSRMRDWKRIEYAKMAGRSEVASSNRQKLEREADALLKISKVRRRPELEAASHKGALLGNCERCNLQTGKIIITRGNGKGGLRVLYFCCQDHAAEGGFAWAGR